MSCVHALSGALSLGALLLSHGAQAQSAHPYAVKWSTTEGAESCSSQAEIMAAVTQLVSADQLSPLDSAERVIFGRARRDESWRATLSVVDSAGNALGDRELKSDAASCSDLGASVALAIALIIDPDHVPAAALAPGGEAARSMGEPAKPRTGAPVASAILPNASVPLDSGTSPPVTRVRVVAFGSHPERVAKASTVLLAGLLPQLAVGAQIELWQPVLGSDSLRFALAYFGAQASVVSGRPEASASLYAITARAAYCPLLAASRQVSVFGCAGLESGLMLARGHGGGYDNAAALGLFALDGALSVDRRLSGGWVLAVTAGAGLTPFRPRFSYRTASADIAVQRRAALEGRLEIGVGYRF